ncbi:MAG TPA: peptidase, partial [Chromatiales bacterium]|nr:peptidase [Chromatiales bacterium]
LLQFLFAADRGNVAVSGRYDILSPGALAMLREIVRCCRSAAVPVSVCGEMAGQQLEAMALVGIGFRSLSMAGSSIGPARLMIRSLDVAGLADFVDTLVGGSAHSVRTALRNYARDHAVTL